MVNNLSDKDKKVNSPQQEADKKSAQPEGSQSAPAAGLNFDSIGAYGQSHALTTDSYEKEWEKKGKDTTPWMDDRKKRMAIRVFSRGVLGAAFFAGGGMLARKWMTRSVEAGRHGYDVSKGFHEQENPLQFIAKLVDTTVGKPIEMAFGQEATRFRPTQFARPGAGGTIIKGRSLGDEVVNVTFDFFCASIGDAWGRDMAGWFDPNVKKDWLVKDEHGNHHIKFPEAIKSALNSVTRYVTYNGGEDWAVAIPYVYFMKGQRAILNKFQPGFAYDFDRNLNGGSFKLGRNPATNEHEVVGNYNKVGMLDLQTRFTVYNIGTLMFRELYDHFKHTLRGRPDHLYGATDPPPGRGILGSIGEIGKWMARSVVKGMIVMTPAVPFFWVNRTPQTKHRGLFIDPEEGVLTHFKGGKGSRRSVHANELRHGDVTTGEQFFLSRFDENTGRWSRSTVAGNNITPVREGRDFNAYTQGRTTFDRTFDAIGNANTQIAGGLDRPPRLTGNFVPTAVYASLAYTPYMIAKGENALLWDSGKMDMSAERMIDGAAALNWGEFKAGAGEVWRTFLHQPLADPAREAEGQRRLMLDRAPTDVFNATGAQMDAEARQSKNRKQAENRWQDFVVGGKPGDQPATPGDDGASTPDTYNIAKRGSYKDEEEVKKVLRETDPPSKSVH